MTIRTYTVTVEDCGGWEVSDYKATVETPEATASANCATEARAVRVALHRHGKALTLRRRMLLKQKVRWLPGETKP